MPSPARRRLVLVLLVVALFAAGAWLLQRVPPATEVASSPETRKAAAPATGPSAQPGAAVRSTIGLRLDPGANELPDHRTAKEQKEAVVKGWGKFIEAQKDKVGAAAFDPAAKRWLARPRVQALLEEWKALEQAWPERSEDQRAAQLPRIEAMWREGMAELAAELTAAGHPTALPEPR
ncbi:MAG: hypothetical protein RLZZ550_776 [Verrucomicrobiota bacterium]|jgi:hypothetical protein